MFDLPIGRLFWTFQRLAAISQICTSLHSQGMRFIEMTEYDYDEMVNYANEFSSLCSTVTLNVTVEASRVVCSDMQLAVQIGEKYRFEYGPFIRLETSLKQLIGCLRSEATTKVAMILRPEFVDLYEQKSPLFGSEVADKFRSALYDITEAGKCLALGRSSACTFHLMHVVEIALKAVHACLGLTAPSNPSWGIWLKQIRDERVRRGDRSWSENDYFQDVYSRLDAIKDAQRDPTMHVQTIHTEAEAFLIFENTKALMKKIASRMDQDGKPLA